MKGFVKGLKKKVDNDSAETSPFLKYSKLWYGADV